jgi:riboflavin synthase
MFTGIVREIGKVERATRRGQSVELTVSAPTTARDLAPGDSVNLNGVCLTAEAAGEGRFRASVMPETLRRTTMGKLRPGAPVNLETALKAGQPMGGHIVAGHVDAVGIVAGRRDIGDSAELVISCPSDIRRYMVVRGSAAVDGVSLTVAEVLPAGFKVSLVRHTLENTTLGFMRPGQEVNIEADILAKYVEALLAARSIGEPSRELEFDLREEEVSL